MSAARNNKIKVSSIAILIIVFVFSLPVFAEERIPDSADASEIKAESAADTPEAPQLENLPKVEAPKTLQDWEIEKARAEAEKAKAEAEIAKAEAEKVRLELQSDREYAEDSAKEEEEDKSKVHTHDGFFLRLAPGFGFAGFDGDGLVESMEGRQPVKDPSYKGASANLSFSIGGAVEENLILHADLWAYSGMFEEDKSYGEEMNVAGLGLGITYYWMPYNVYLTGSIGPAVTVLSFHDDEDGKSENIPGIALSAMVGKEWWVSDNWGLGLSAKLNYAYTKNDNVKIHQGGGAVFFSATFN